ncbi:MAG: chemotaxis protein CheW, partial [Myxococcales bacterium]|nr:chemotaxis protein CheW [Myxococcales bacterium]
MSPGSSPAKRSRETDLRRELESLRARLYDLESRLLGDLAAEELTEESYQILLCRAGEERVGIVLQLGAEVVPIAELAALPEAPPWVCGLLDVRGQIVPVLDVSARFARSSRALELSDLVVVCPIGERRVGLVVQEVFDVTQVRSEEIEPAAPEMSHGPYLLGAARHEGALLLLL